MASSKQAVLVSTDQEQSRSELSGVALLFVCFVVVPFKNHISICLNTNRFLTHKRSKNSVAICFLESH